MGDGSNESLYYLNEELDPNLQKGILWLKKIFNSQCVFSQDENDGEWEEETQTDPGSWQGEYWSDDGNWRRQDRVDQKRIERESNMIDGNVKSLQDICAREILRFGERTSSSYKFDELYIQELPLPRLFKTALSDWIITWYNVDSESDYSDDSYETYSDGTDYSDDTDGS